MLSTLGFSIDTYPHNFQTTVALTILVLTKHLKICKLSRFYCSSEVSASSKLSFGGWVEKVAVKEEADLSKFL